MSAKSILAIVVLLFSIGIKAQSRQLPYKNFFSTTSERNEMTTVRTGANSTYSWSYNQTSGFASHDYPVGGSETDTVSDWLFTPPIRIVEGTILSFRYTVFGITGTATPVDEFSVWYGKGSMDPFNGSFVKLADLTHKIENQYNWHDTNSIQLPFATDTGLICFRYKATNNWFVINLDSIVVTQPGLSIPDFQTPDAIVYPNPGTGTFNVISKTPMQNITVTNQLGKEILTIEPADPLNAQLDLSAAEAGYYIIKFITATGTYYRKLTIN